MKAVLISIQPRWCDLIAKGEKTIEVRRTRPKLPTPFKCYIYCTKATKYFFHGGIGETLDDLYRLPNGEIKYGYSGELMLYDEHYSKDNFLNGKIIGEFVCDRIEYFGNVATDQWEYLAGNVHEYHKRLVTEEARLTESEMLSYKGKWGWHISDLVIYEKPKLLSEFHKPGCTEAKNGVYGWTSEEEKSWQITRVPQSWCYVEELCGAAV